MRLSNVIIIIAMLCGTAVLTSLGWWQIERLYWKEDLIAKVENRIKLAPIEINEFLDRQILEDNWPYTPVTAAGVFDHSKEVYFFATDKKGGSGWNVHTPLKLNSGKILIVNRGFVPFTFKDPATRRDGQVEGEQIIIGLIRVPQKQKPSSSFENAPEKREFYWRSHPQMVHIMRDSEQQEFVPFFVDANDAPNPGGWPKGGTTIISFPNSHLQYAGTWFGLALTLLGVGGYFLYTRRKTGIKT